MKMVVNTATPASNLFLAQEFMAGGEELTSMRCGALIWYWLRVHCCR
ncbi:MAG: hypothetical protein ABL862_03695 [Candidatus Nitrotoga sp.]